MERPDDVGNRGAETAGLDMDALVGYTLLGGLMLSLVLIIAGLIWHWLLTGSLTAEYVIKGMNLSGFLAQVVFQMVSGKIGPKTVLNLGICFLLLTPFVRVLVSVFYFAIEEHNWKYTTFTGIVLTVLTYSLFLR